MRVCVFKGFSAVLLRKWLQKQFKKKQKRKRGEDVSDTSPLSPTTNYFCRFHIYNSKNNIMLCSPTYVFEFLFPFLGSNDGYHAPLSALNHGRINPELKV